jgi:hypothetical protein
LLAIVLVFDGQIAPDIDTYLGLALPVAEPWLTVLCRKQIAHVNGAASGVTPPLCVISHCVTVAESQTLPADQRQLP